jgi:8-oxo-dGTP pyrophosphatase MutT (NUDIX family)
MYSVRKCFSREVDIKNEQDRPSMLLKDVLKKTPRHVKSYGKRTVKRSAGIACCRYNKSECRYEVLMVRKRYTYGFAAFVFGQYNKNDNTRLVALFDTMTNQEKLDIMSMKFDMMWWRIWLNFPGDNLSPDSSSEDDWLDIYKRKTMSNLIHTSPPKTKQELYIKKKAKFEAAFLQDNGLRLESLIKKSNSSAELLWEIPKGRIGKNETKIDCATREFKEEAGIDISYYDIAFDVSPFVDSFTHMGVTYCNSYYIGLAVFDFEPTISFDVPTQLIEVDAVKWVGIDELRYLNQSTQTCMHLTKIFKIIKNRYKHIKETDTV